MPERCFGYQGVNHHHFGSELCPVHTWNDNLGDSLPHVNEVVTSETFECVCGHIYINAKKFGVCTIFFNAFERSLLAP